MKLPGGLPNLEGLRGRIVRGLYLAILLPTVLAILGSVWSSANDTLHNFPATMQFGFRTFTLPSGEHHIGGVTPEAARAGVRAGDRIVAIDQAALRARATEFEVGERLASAPGDGVTLRVRGTQGDLRTVRLPRDPHPWQRIDRESGLPLWGYALVNTLARESLPIVLIIASVLLYRRRRRDSEAMLFALSMLMLCIRGGSLWWWAGSPFSVGVLQIWWTVGWILSFIAIAGFPDGRFESRAARWAVAGLIGVLIAFLLLQGIGGLFVFSEGTLRPLSGMITVALVLAAVAAGVAVVLRYRRTAPGPERQQIKWAVGGSCVTLAALVLLVVFETLQIGTTMRGNPLVFSAFSLVSMLALIGMPLGLMVSLLRFRLYDAEATMSRSTVYAALTLSLLAIFAATEKLVEAFGQQYFGGSLGTIAGGIGAALAAVMIAPLHHRLSDWSERRFQQALVQLRIGLPLLMGDLRETASTAEVAAAVIRRVESGARARRAALQVEGEIIATSRISTGEIDEWRRGWVPRDGDGLDCRRDDPLFPMRVPLEADGCGRVGWLLLGPRPDGSFYGKDEREALVAVADPVARALAIVRRREQRQAHVEARIETLEASLARLIARKAKPAG